MKTQKTYLSVSILAAAEAVIAFILGFFASYLFSLPTGASIVAVHMLFYVASIIIREARIALVGE